MICRSILTTALALSLFAIGSAKADISFDLGDGNQALAGFTGPFATVTVHANNTTQALITFTAASGFFLGAQGLAAVNVNGSFTLGTINAPPTASNGGSATEDGFGKFNQTLDNSDGANDAVTSVSFLVNATGGNSWALDASNVLTENSNGALAAAHIFAGCTGAVGNRSCVATGYASGNDGGGPIQNDAPEPTSITLLGGIVLFATATIRRRMRRS